MKPILTSRRGFFAAAGAALIAGRSPAQQSETPQHYAYALGDFSRGSEGWLAGFSDYSIETANNDRVAEIRSLPAEVGREGRAYFLSARNTSDDLFMFLKKPVGGLEPERSYRVDFFIEFASAAASNCVGIGGAPGESVWLKAGVSAVEPLPLLEGEAGNNIRLNVDKGGQSNGGEDASVVDVIANGIPCEESDGEYVLLERTHRHPTTVQTGIDGVLWVFVGTDSGFEGTTSLYYSRIVALLTLVEEAQL